MIILGARSRFRKASRPLPEYFHKTENLLRLQKSTVVSGRLLDIDNQPIASAKISLLGFSYLDDNAPNIFLCSLPIKGNFTA